MAMMRKTILLTGVLALGATHCGGSSTPPSNTPEAAPEPSSASATPDGSLSDAQIATITDKVNTAEIEQARIAQTKSSDEQVRQFAQMMIEHHGQAKAQQAGLGLGTADSPLSQELDREAQSTLETLQAKSGAEFDRAYLQAQVDAHQKALDTIRQQLIPNAQAPELRSYLENLAPQVEQHLTQARSALEASGSASASGATGMR
jgi:putative membrane protein